MARNSSMVPENQDKLGNFKSEVGIAYERIRKKRHGCSTGAVIRIQANERPSLFGRAFSYCVGPRQFRVMCSICR